MANWLTKLFGGKKEESQPDNMSEDNGQENVSQSEENVEHREEAPVASEPEVKENDNSEEEKEDYSSQDGEEEEKTW